MQMGNPVSWAIPDRKSNPDELVHVSVPAKSRTCHDQESPPGIFIAFRPRKFSRRICERRRKVLKTRHVPFVLDSFDVEPIDPVVLHLKCGYLTIAETFTYVGRYMFRMRVPNQEGDLTSMVRGGRLFAGIP